jgi:molybdopterin/thiamine biosynthesis adenylyltransferase
MSINTTDNSKEARTLAVSSCRPKGVDACHASTIRLVGIRILSVPCMDTHVNDCSFYSAPVSAHVRNTRVADRGLPTANLTDGLGSTALLMFRRRSVSRVHSKIHRSVQVSAYAYKQRL